MGDRFFKESMKAGVAGKFIIHKNEIGNETLFNFRFLVMRPKRLDTLTGFSLSKEIKEVDKKSEVEFLEQHHAEWMHIAMSGIQVKVEDEEGTWQKIDHGNFKVVKKVDDETFIRLTGLGKTFEGIYKLTEENGEFNFEKPGDQKLEVEKEKPGVIKNLVNWRSKEAIMGTPQMILRDISAVYGIERKFVAVEYPERRFIDYLKDNYKTSHATYANLSDGEDHVYMELAIHGDNLDAFIINIGCHPSLVIFFDDPTEVEKVLQLTSPPGEEYVNYKKGSYELRETMAGYVLVPINVKSAEAPIFDDDIVKSLQHDTDQFFRKRDFYKGNNACGVKIPHKRGILMYGPPGNGKTTFIKNFMGNNLDKFTVLIDSSDVSVGPDTYKFLEKSLGTYPKVLIFEDVDSIAQSHWKRSAFLNFLDGVNALDNSLIVGTTNYPKKLDSALLKRRSRFDRIYRIGYPSDDMRKKFIQKWFPYIQDPLLTDYAAKSKGFSGADFKEIFILQGIQECSIVEAIQMLNGQLSIYEDIISPVEKYIKQDIGEYLWYDKTKDHKITKRVEILKQETEKGQEEQTVFGEVLIPDEVDAHKDIYTAKDVEQAAHFFMENFANMGFMHRFFVNGDVKILETFIAPVNMTLTTTKGGKRKIKKGTWLMKVRIIRKDLWQMVKEGKLTGFSIGGLATVRELRKMLKAGALTTEYGPILEMLGVGNGN